MTLKYIHWHFSAQTHIGANDSVSKLVDVAGVEPACLIFFYLISTSLVLIVRLITLIQVIRIIGIAIMSFYLFHFSQTTFSLVDEYKYSENLLTFIAVV